MKCMVFLRFSGLSLELVGYSFVKILYLNTGRLVSKPVWSSESSIYVERCKPILGI